MFSRRAKRGIIKSVAHENTDAPPQPCTICLEDVVDRGRLGVCPHWFCFNCILEWSKNTNTCPLCKKRFRCISRVSIHDSGVPKTTVRIKDKDITIDNDVADDYDVAMGLLSEDESFSSEGESESEYEPSFLITSNDIEEIGERVTRHSVGSQRSQSQGRTSQISSRSTLETTSTVEERLAANTAQITQSRGRGRGRSRPSRLEAATVQSVPSRSRSTRSGSGRQGRPRRNNIYRTRYFFDSDSFIDDNDVASDSSTDTSDDEEVEDTNNGRRPHMRSVPLESPSSTNMISPIQTGKSRKRKRQSKICYVGQEDFEDPEDFEFNPSSHSQVSRNEMRRSLRNSQATSTGWISMSHKTSSQPPTDSNNNKEASQLGRYTRSQTQTTSSSRHCRSQTQASPRLRRTNRDHDDDTPNNFPASSFPLSSGCRKSNQRKSRKNKGFYSNAMVDHLDSDSEDHNFDLERELRSRPFRSPQIKITATESGNLPPRERETRSSCTVTKSNASVDVNVSTVSIDDILVDDVKYVKDKLSKGKNNRQRRRVLLLDDSDEGNSSDSDVMPQKSKRCRRTNHFNEDDDTDFDSIITRTNFVQNKSPKFNHQRSPIPRLRRKDTSITSPSLSDRTCLLVTPKRGTYSSSSTSKRYIEAHNLSNQESPTLSPCVVSQQSLSQSSNSSKSRGRKNSLSPFCITLDDCKNRNSKANKLQISKQAGSGASSNVKIDTLPEDKENSYLSSPDIIASTPQGKERFKPLFKRFHRNPRQTFEE